MVELKKYAAFIHNYCLDEISRLFGEQLKESHIDFPDGISNLPESEYFAAARKNFSNILSNIRDNTIYEYIDRVTLQWKKNKFIDSNGKKMDLHHLIKALSIQKHCLIHFLPRYSVESAVAARAMSELVILYDYYREQVYVTFLEIQHEDIEREKEFALTILDTTIEGISGLDKELRVRLWNKALAERTGIKKEEILGKNIFDIFPMNRGFEENLILRAQTGERVHMENIPIKSRPGFYDLEVIPWRDNESKIIGTLSFSRDVTEKKRHLDELAATLNALRKTEEQLLEANNRLERNVEARTKELADSKEELKQTLERTVQLNKELIQQENFLSSIIYQTPVSTCVLDSDGTLLRVNQAYLNLFQIQDPGDVIGKYNVLKDEEFRQQGHNQQISDVFQKGTIASFSMIYDQSKIAHIKANARNSIYLNITIFPIINSEGKVINAVIKHEDVTNKYLAEKALAKSEEELRLITESLPELISYVDKNLNFRFVNKAYTEWFKKSKEEIIGKNVADLMGEKNFMKIRSLIEKALNGMAIKSEETIFIDHKIKKNVLINYVPNNAHGKTEGFYSLISDISPLKKAQEDLLKKNTELTRINSDLDNFIYTASHDLKSPIVNLEGLIAAIERTLKPKLDDRENILFNMMKTSIVKLKNTIAYLSDVTKVSQNFEKRFQQLNIPEIVEDVKSDIHELIKTSNARFIEDYQVKEASFVKAYLKSIFYNLITNAIKYRSPHREAVVKILTYEEGNFLAIRIEDNGLGLSEAQQTKLFSMFKRIHTQGEGSGIGLYILKRIVENMNGKIEVESQLDKGSKFTVYIPLS